MRNALRAAMTLAGVIMLGVGAYLIGAFLPTTHFVGIAGAFIGALFAGTGARMFFCGTTGSGYWLRALKQSGTDTSETMAQVVLMKRSLSSSVPEAVDAIDRGDIDRLRDIIARNPEIVHARTNLEPPLHYFSGATLLHHVAGNPDRGRLDGSLGPMPANTPAIARLLLDAGADANAETIGPNGGTTMGLVITSKQASDSNLSGPLMDVLLEYGAHLDVANPASLSAPLSNHAPRAAEKMIELGAHVSILAAAGLGNMEQLRACFDGNGNLTNTLRRDGRVMEARDAIGLALLVAYVNDQRNAVDFLLEKDGNWNMIGVNNGTALHRAAWAGDIDMLARLVAKGADVNNRANPFNATPLSWAQHNRQSEAFDWLRTHCAIDLHDAVCHDLPEHIEARLREDPSSVNRRIDQWDIPQCTPLHWAAWTTLHDVDGAHEVDLDQRERTIRTLLRQWRRRECGLGEWDDTAGCRGGIEGTAPCGTAGLPRRKAGTGPGPDVTKTGTATGTMCYVPPPPE